MPAEILGAEIIARGWSTLTRVRLRTPDGAEVERHVEDHGDAVAVLPYDPERRVLMFVRQPRAAVCQAGEDDIIEIAAGQLEGSDPVPCVRREAMEEMGLELADLEQVANCWSMPGVSTERLHLFIARYSSAHRVGPGGGAEGEHENISVIEMPARQAWEAAMSGRLPDMKTLLAVHALKARRPGLFD